MLEKSLIGKIGRPVTYEVERGHIRRFAEAIGDPNPVYRDEAAAIAAGYPAIPAPPTFATTFREGNVREGLDLDLQKLLHGEQSYRFRRPLYAGDRITCVDRIADVYEKRGKSGAMDFLVIETTGTDEEGEEVFTTTASIILRR